MPKFFLSYVPDEQAVLTGEDGRHIAKSLRMRPGETLTLCDCIGMDYEGEILSIEGETVTIKILACTKCAAEPTLKATLYQALPKQDKFDSVVQKAVELGVARVVPVMTARCVSRPEEKALAKKVERWRKIAVEAAKQSGRGILPQVGDAMPFRLAVEEAEAAGGVNLLFYEGGGARISALVDESVRTLSLFIGPEGGFEASEVELAAAHGIRAATLGPRILRTETAPIAALAAIMQASGNL